MRSSLFPVYTGYHLLRSAMAGFQQDFWATHGTGDDINPGDLATGSGSRTFGNDVKVLSGLAARIATFAQLLADCVT